MIIEWLWSVAGGFTTWLATLFPTNSTIATLGSSESPLLTFLNGATNLGAWIPWAAIGISVGIVTSFFGTMFGVKLVMKIVAFVPFFGGSG